ncbi:MAG TPA: DUF6484 domain-containing protein [Telluria sp.]|jgi:hypothetical protein
MGSSGQIESEAVAIVEQQAGTDSRGRTECTSLSALAPAYVAPGLVIGELVAMMDEGRTPLVLFPGQPGSAAVAARSVVDLYGTHIGRSVVLMFENNDPGRPLVMGVLRADEQCPLEERPGQVVVDTDGERLTVSAQQQLVLRCGTASITLTRAGKVLIKGDYVATCSSGLHRIKGGSVQIN